MAIEAKISFMEQLKVRLADIMTIEQMSQIERIGFDLLDRFDMKEIVDNSGPDDFLDSYIAAMQVECRSPKTIERYIYIIGRLMKFAKVPTRQISIYHLRNFIAAEKERGIQDSTLEGYREIFSAYFNWLRRETLIDKNPCANLGVIKCAKKEKRTYSECEMERLYRCCDTPRNLAILHFLRSTGCRISEATELNREQIDLERMECVVHGKGNKDRTVYLDNVASMVIGEYLAQRDDNSQALFIGKRGERLQPGGVRTMLKHLAKHAGVDHVHPHKFRRTLATDLARRGMPIQEISRVLGHEKLDTTMKYVILNNDDIKASYRRYA